MNTIKAELRKFVAPEFVFGEGARLMAARYAKNLGASKVLIVTDPGIIAAGWAKDVTAGMESEGVAWHLFSGVSPNPRKEEVMKGAEEYEREGCDTIVVVGGGSPTDCAKGIGIVNSNMRNILEFEGVDQVPAPGPPLICIPTTAGSSADISQFAIITDTQRMLKIAIISKTVVPDASLIDPLTLTTMSADLTAHTGIDALAHAMEAYVSNANSPVTDLFAIEAAGLIAANLALAVERPDDISIRYKTMLGSMYAGLAFSNASLGLVHAMAHSLRGLLDIPHGQCNAMMLCQVVGFNFESASDRYIKIGEALGVHASSKEALISKLEEMKKELDANATLGDLGVKRSDIPELAAKAIKDPCLATNPRKPTQKDIELLYEQAL